VIKQSKEIEDMKLINKTGILHVACALALLPGCGDDDGATSDKGTVQVFIEPEATVSEGIEPGADEENMSDGWRATYDRFLVTVGNVRAARSDAQETLGDARVVVLDLKAAPAGGYVFTEFEEVSAVRWDRFGYDLPNAKAGVETLAPTQTADVELMIEGGYSIYIEGSIEKADGQSCPRGDTTVCVPAPKVTFRWGLAAGTSFDDCATVEGVSGFAVPVGGTVPVKPTIHGDHWFFSNVTAGVELTKRYAQYIADSDLDGDGETTLEELKQVNAAEVFPSPKYSLAGALGGPVETAYDYVLAQARTLGDFQGEGECATREVLP
jgi:hypothetical protein